MLNLWGTEGRFCDNVNRREFLRVGALGVAGLSLADILRLRSRASAASVARCRSIILICLRGGPSQIDTWDMKPDAPADYRGQFKPIASKVPGMDFCELMPLQAQIADKLSIVRGLQSIEDQHFMNEVYSGFPKAAHRPAWGSVVARLKSGEHDILPRYVTFTDEDLAEYEEPGYIGGACKPFRPTNEGLNNLGMHRDMSLSRLGSRKELLTAFDSMRRDLDTRGEAVAMDKHTLKALEMVTSSRAREAFDLNQEPDKVRARYPKGPYRYFERTQQWNADRFLLARRLVEAGVSVVTISPGTWDNHGDIFTSYRNMLPLLDASIHALVTDLHERGMSEDVAVVVLGEFGRGPRVNKDGGRDHWAPAGCAVFAGGGLKMGQVIGETDSRAERPKANGTTFQNITATYYHVLGIDPNLAFPDFTGRPMLLLDDVSPIRRLVGG